MTPIFYLAKPIPEAGRRLVQSEANLLGRMGVSATVSDLWKLFPSRTEGNVTVRHRERNGEGASWEVPVTPSGAPNFDGMDPEDLMAFWVLHQGGRHVLGIIPEGGQGSRRAVADLANYASNKATAIRCRLSGMIQQAMEYESICDRIYSALPASVRW